MNLRDRLLGAIRGEPVDRVPLILEEFHYAPSDRVQDPGKQEILERVAQHLSLFQSSPCYVNRCLVTPEWYMREIDRQERNGETIVTTEIETPRRRLTAVTGRNRISDTTWTIKYSVESWRKSTLSAPFTGNCRPIWRRRACRTCQITTQTGA